MDVSVLKKASDLRIVTKAADIDGQRINYKRLVVEVNFGDDVEEVEFVPASSTGKGGYKLLQRADDVE